MPYAIEGTAEEDEPRLRRSHSEDVPEAGRSSEPLRVGPCPPGRGETRDGRDPDMREARVMLRQWGVSDSDIESLASILRTQDFDVETGLEFEKSIDPMIVQGIWFIIRIAADESLRELVGFVWHAVLDRIQAISEKKGPTRVDIDFRAPGPHRHSGDLEFRIQARTNEPDALKWLDGMVSRLAELGIVSI